MSLALSVNAQQLVDAVSLGSLYALAALGIALLFGIMGLINFAYGELIMVGGYVLTFSVIVGLPIVLIVLTLMAVVTFVALLQERLAFRPVRGTTGTTLLVTSFALSFFLQSAAIMFGGAKPKGVGNVLGGGGTQYEIAGLRVSQIDLYTVGAAFSLLALLVMFFKRTQVGIHMRACAEDFEMARFLGVRANRIIAGAFAISGILAAVVALLLTARTGSVSPSMGLKPVLIAFVATVIGGMGSLTGAVLGGFLLAFLTIGIQAVLPGDVGPYRDAFAFTIVIGILLVRPQGLISSATGREW